MDERVSLRSHLDRAASQTPHGVAIGEVVKAIAAAAIDLAALIADGPLAGITGGNGGVNPDGDQQKDIDLAADEMIRRALRHTPVAAVLSRKRNCRRPCVPIRHSVSRSIRSTDRPTSTNNIAVGTIFRSNPGARTFSRPSSNPGRRNAPGFIVYGPQTTFVLALNASVDISSSTGRRRNSC